MEREISFSECMSRIKAAMQKGDVQRLAEKAGCSSVTFGRAFKRTSAEALTNAEQRVLQTCLHDEALQERLRQANELESQLRNALV